MSDFSPEITENDDQEFKIVNFSDLSKEELLALALAFRLNLQAKDEIEKDLNTVGIARPLY